jgi:hypothetical protein
MQLVKLEYSFYHSTRHRRQESATLCARRTKILRPSKSNTSPRTLDHPSRPGITNRLHARDTNSLESDSSGLNSPYRSSGFDVENKVSLDLRRKSRQSYWFMETHHNEVLHESSE